MTAANHSFKYPFIWQPMLLLAVAGYLVAEVYFLTLLVNSLYFATHYSDLKQLEITGRLISGAGLGLSVLIGLSLSQRLNQKSRVKRLSLKIAAFIAVTIMGYVAMKELYLFLERNASKPIVHCSILGNAANRVFSKGTLPKYQSFIDVGGRAGYSEKQLIRLYLPLHVCINDNYKAILEASPTIEIELASMVHETGLPEKIAQPAIAIYNGFRDNLERFYPAIEKLDKLHNEPEQTMLLRQNQVTEFSDFLATQSRYTRNDIRHLSQVYQCALQKLLPGATGAPEQRFLLAVSQCLYDIARVRFDTLPEVTRASDIIKLEQNIAFHWARQFIASPEDIPEEAFNLMRKSFALVFLPTYAVMVSTFIAFICLAAYLRTRFLIRAQKLNKRVNPVLNACLSPLVVVPFIWTAIFLWLPSPAAEKVLFPSNGQTQWVRALQVTQRPLFYYYDLSLYGFNRLDIPVSFGATREQGRDDKIIDMGLKLEDFTGFYALQLCAAGCQSARLELNAAEQTGQVYYRAQKCTTSLVYEAGNHLQHFVFHEVPNSRSDCGERRQWHIRPAGNTLEIDLLSDDQVVTTSATNLFI